MPAVDPGSHTPGPEPTATSGRPHKRVHWRQPKPPSGKKRRPAVLDATRDGLVRGLEQRQGSLWMRISRNVIVAGYALDKALTRVRALRKDGAESLLAMSVALLYLADVRTGFVGKPRQGGGPPGSDIPSETSPSSPMAHRPAPSWNAPNARST